MTLSIVVVSCNRADSLALTIRSVKAMTPRPSLDAELVVVDNNCRDHTRRVVEEAARDSPIPIRSVFEPRQGSNFARNAGIAQSTGEILAFIDDDNTLSPDWLAGVEQASADCGQTKLIAGRILPVFPGHMPGFMPEWIPDTWRPMYGLQDYGPVAVKIRPPILPVEMNLIVARDVFRKCGVFGTAVQRSNRGLVSNDGLDFFNRVHASGEECMYHPALLAYHHIPAARAEPNYLLSRAYWQGVSDARCDPQLATLPRTKLLRAAMREAWWLVKNASGGHLSPRRVRRHFKTLAFESRCLMAHRRGVMTERLRAALMLRARRATGPC